MSSSPDMSFSRILPSDVFHQLGELLQQTVCALGDRALVLTEAVLAPIVITQEWCVKKFTLVVSPQFSALLVGEHELDTSTQQYSTSFLETNLNAEMTFHPEAIVNFILQLKDLFAVESETRQNLERYQQIPCENNATLQVRFTLNLLEYFLPQPRQEILESPPSPCPHISVCQQAEEALKKQIAQEKLLNKVATTIRRSLELPLIMTTAVEHVRDFLELDRLVIYKFEDSTVKSQELTVNGQQPNHSENSLQSYQDFSSCVVYEVRASDEIVSVLNYQENNCFTYTSPCWDKFRQGFTLIVDDVDKTYALEDCFLNFLRNAKIKAKLAAPIMFEDKLWGLIIAHQCVNPRHWTENEKNLLTSIAEQLAIAINQNELMRSLTQEKLVLEKRVLERTMDLRDALMAAEAASRLRSEFLATISHELLTPLTYVIGMSSTLLRWPFGELSQKQRDYLQTIHDSGEHLLEMINDILDLSQIEAGKAVLNITELSLIEIAEASIQSLSDKAVLSGINLTLDLQVNREGYRFNADARRIQQILWNLLTNAIKFTPEGGDVTLRVWIEDDSAVFQVEDSGIGIPEEQLPQLFEKFHQLDTPYRRRYGGTGLGLALTKQLVELHRGRIEVESTVDVGSIFTVWIPFGS